MLVGMVDTIFADVAQPDQVSGANNKIENNILIFIKLTVQARIVAINAHNFLKSGGHFVISIKVNCFGCGLT